MSDYSNILKVIETSEDPEKLRQIEKNAREQNAPEVRKAALRRITKILTKEKSDTIEHDFWTSIHALEEARTIINDRTTRLTRTRQKIKRDGVMETLRSLATSKKPRDGFLMLMELNMPELTAEAVVLRHSAKFEDHVVEAARQRLVEHGVDLKKLQIK